MTVEELIKVLEKYPKDMRVFVTDEETGSCFTPRIFKGWDSVLIQ